MRHKNPELMRKIREFAENYFFSEGRSPSTTDISSNLGIARGTAYKYLIDMAQQGIISYDGKSIVTEKIRRLSPNTHVRVYDGAVPCGPLGEVTADIDEYVKLPVSIFGDGDLYIVRTQGESMIEAGIQPGDLVVVDRQKRPVVGDIIVAYAEGGNSLKRLAYDKVANRFYLHPENSNMEDIYIAPGKLETQGVARFVIKAL